MENQVLEGGLYLAALGGLLAALRYVPRLLLDRLFSSSVYIRDQHLQRWVGEWLAASEYGRRCRVLFGFTAHDEDEPRAILKPGIGFHAFRYDGRWYFMRQALEEEGRPGWYRP